MGDLWWKIKQLMQKMMPLLMIAFVAYAAHYFYKHRTFRHGIGSGVRSIVHKIPFFGSHYRRGGRHSYAYGRRHRRHHRHHGRRHHGRRHHR